MKIRPVGAKLFHGDRRTDGKTERHDEPFCRFSHNFANSPKKTRHIYPCSAQDSNPFC